MDPEKQNCNGKDSFIEILSLGIRGRLNKNSKNFSHQPHKLNTLFKWQSAS